MYILKRHKEYLMSGRLKLILVLISKYSHVELVTKVV